MGHRMSGSASCYFRNSDFRTRHILNAIFQYCLYFLLLHVIATSEALEIQETRHISINRPVSKSSFQFPKWVQYSTDYVRCFCNLPSCVLTSYMCKSSEGACFSDILHDGLTIDSNGIHGCMELLTNKTKQRVCRKSDNNDPTLKQDNSKSVIMCCYSDMCNHVDNPRVRNVLNDSSLGVYGEVNENTIPINVRPKEVPSLYTDSEVWFRAATIAVPICGAVILLVLIMLAIRLLRSERSKNSIRKFGKTQDILWSPNCHKSGFSSPSYLHQNNLQTQADDSYKKKINDERLNNGQFCIPLLVEEQNSKANKSSLGNVILNNSQEVENTFSKPAEMSIGVVNNIRNCSSNKLTISENVSESSNSTIGKVYYKESLSST